jgi:copper chaperone CopZ
MSQKPGMKEIRMETLSRAGRKSTVSRGKKALLSLIVLALFTGTGFAAYRLIAGQTLAARFAVDKMTCPACSETIEETAGKVPGVFETNVSLAARQVNVTYRQKQTKPEIIRKQIAGAGYPASFDGRFDPDAEDAEGSVIAYVNGWPLFPSDLKLSMDTAGSARGGLSGDFFSAAGLKILLMAADEQMIVVQPHEIDQEIEKLAKTGGLSRAALLRKAGDTYDSKRRFRQVVAQKIAARYLVVSLLPSLQEHAAENGGDALARLGDLFKAAEVRIIDADVKESLHASFGATNWQTFWPHMVSEKTELAAMLTE